MRLPDISRATRVHELGRRIHLEGGPRAVLLLHGWTGWPGRLEPLAGRLHREGYTVSVPRLPGHGTSVDDMLQTDAADWLRCAIDAYLDLSAEHPDVSVAGTSMGAILAAMVAAMFDVPRVVLLAPAYRNTRRLIVITPFVRRIVRRIRGDWREDHENSAGAKELGREYATWNYTGMAAELLRMQRAGTRALRRLRSETLVIVSRADTAVPASVSEYIRSRCAATRFESLVVDRSNHHLAEHVDRDLVADAVVDWFADRSR